MGWLPVWSGGIDALKLYEPYSLLDDIINAINERKEALGHAYLTMADKLDEPATLMNTIQGNIGSLITSFVNHLDSSGDWNGKATLAEVAPDWTEASMLTAIGAPSRILPSKLFVDADWLYQQYEIIKFLLWTQNRGYAEDQTIGLTNSRHGSSSGEASGQAAYDAAQIDWNSNSWGSFQRPRIEALTTLNYNGATYSGYIVTRRSAPMWNNTTDFDINTQLYCYSKAWLVDGYEDSTGNGVAEDTFGVITSGAVSANTNHTFPSVTPASPTKSSDPLSGEFSSNGFQMDIHSSIGRKWVLKFGGVGGFTFK